MEGTIEIKKKISKRKCLRPRKRSSSDDENSDKEDESFTSKIEEMKTLQRLRERPRGVEIVGTSGEIGQPIVRDDTKDSGDPFKVKSGGMVNMKNLVLKKIDDPYDVGIGTQFSAETNKRDEDEEMMKYIEEELTKKKNQESSASGTGDGSAQKSYYSPEDAALQAVPDHLRTSSTTRSEEMLSNQMLSGIPEVDLGIEPQSIEFRPSNQYTIAKRTRVMANASMYCWHLCPPQALASARFQCGLLAARCKIKNIEATEEAKLRLVWEQRNKKEGPSQFVPTNITVNFAQPTKINTEEEIKRDECRPGKRPVTVMDTGKRDKSGKTAAERATDDFHYERFKKQFRRY